MHCNIAKRYLNNKHNRFINKIKTLAERIIRFFESCNFETLSMKRIDLNKRTLGSQIS